MFRVMNVYECHKNFVQYIMDTVNYHVVVATLLTRCVQLFNVCYETEGLLR